MRRLIPLNNWVADRLNDFGGWLTDLAFAMKRCSDCGRRSDGPACIQ